MNDKTPQTMEEVVGERLRLRTPIESDYNWWAGWLRDPKTTRYLDHTDEHHTAADQQVWVKNALALGRVFFVAERLDTSAPVGVCSISTVTADPLSGHASFVFPASSARPRFAALEARALLTHYAFTSLGKNQLESGQVFPGNRRWTELQQLVGWFPESLRPLSWQKGGHFYDAIRTIAHHTTVAELAHQRLGSLWPGLAAIEDFLESNPGALEKSIDDFVADQRTARARIQALVSQAQASR